MLIGQYAGDKERLQHCPMSATKRKGTDSPLRSELSDVSEKKGIADGSCQVGRQFSVCFSDSFWYENR